MSFSFDLPDLAVETNYIDNINKQIIKTNKIKIGKNIKIIIISNNLFIKFKGSEHFFQIIFVSYI